jgi:hypothetical protein
MASRNLPHVFAPAKRNWKWFHEIMTVELAGGIWVGIQEGVDRFYVVFTDPVIGSSLMVPVEGITVSTVQAHMVSSRAAFGVVLP